MGALDKLIEAKKGQASKGDPMQVAMLELVSRLADKHRNELSNTEMARGLIASLEAMQKETQKLVKSLDQSKANSDVASALKTIANSQEKLAQQVSKLQNTDNEPVIKAVNALREAIQSVQLPEPDLTPIMAEMRRMKPPKRPELKMILDKVEAMEASYRGETWRFTPERNDFDDKIKEVIATRVS